MASSKGEQNEQRPRDEMPPIEGPKVPLARQVRQSSCIFLSDCTLWKEAKRSCGKLFLQDGTHCRRQNARGEVRISFMRDGMMKATCDRAMRSEGTEGEGDAEG